MRNLQAKTQGKNLKNNFQKKWIFKKMKKMAKNGHFRGFFLKKWAKKGKND